MSPQSSIEPAPLRYFDSRAQRFCERLCEVLPQHAELWGDRAPAMWQDIAGQIVASIRLAIIEKDAKHVLATIQSAVLVQGTLPLESIQLLCSLMQRSAFAALAPQESSDMAASTTAMESVARAMLQTSCLAAQSHLDSTRKSEARFRMSAEHAQDIVYRYRLENPRGFEYVSPSSKAILGYAPEEYYADPDLDLKVLHPDSRTHFDSFRQSANSHPEPVIMHCVHKDGREIWLEQRSWTISNEAGKPVAIEGITRNITRRKQLEEALRESQTRYRAIVEDLPEPVCRFRPDYTLTFVNDACCHYFGKTSAELLGSSFLRLILPEDHEHIVVQLSSFSLENSLLRTEYRALNAQGQIRWIQWVVRSLFDTQHHIIEFQAVGHDTTSRRRLEETLDHRVKERTAQFEVANQLLHQEIAERERDIAARKHAEEALRQTYDQLEEVNHRLQHSRDVLRTIFDRMNDGLMLFDEHGNLLALNQAMASLLESTVLELFAQPWSERWSLAPSDKTRTDLITIFLNELRDALHEGQALRRREHFVRPDGNKRVLDIQAMPIKDALVLAGQDAGVRQAMLHVVDVTESIQMEAMMIENARLTSGMELISIIAHEINTPLQTILASLQLMRRSDKTRLENFLALAEKEIKRVSTIVAQLKDLYHPNPEHVRQVDINALIERVLQLASGHLVKKRVQVERHLEANLPTVSIRHDQLNQVFLNLIINAIDSMQTYGKLSVRTQQVVAGSLEDGPENQEATAFPQVMIEITDNGMGIDSSVLAHIFDPFFTTKSQGTGLGLFVSKKIVTIHQGRIDVRSQPGEGTTFTVLLPVGGMPEPG